MNSKTPHLDNALAVLKSLYSRLSNEEIPTCDLRLEISEAITAIEGEKKEMEDSTKFSRIHKTGN